jgi:hypothetical protein
MTKKDYELIAGTITDTIFMSKIIGDIDMENAERVLSLLAGKLATKLEAENPRFNRALFLEACGVK